MKIKQIMLAVAATLASAQAFAAPVTLADIVTAGSAVVQHWVSGASASAFPMYDAFETGCDAGTQAIFTNATSTSVKPGSLGNFMAYACQRGGVIHVLYHTVAGGSLFAYTPHTLGLGNVNGFVDRLKPLQSTTCTGTAGTFVSVNGGVNTNVPVNRGCALSGATQPNIAAGTNVLSTDGGPALPGGGFSDVEAAAFGSLGAGASTAGTESVANVGQAFGIAVNVKYYRALQVAQAIYPDLATAGTSDPLFDPANAPNITTAEYSSIVALNGKYQIKVNIPANLAGSSANHLYVVRRTDTSGTQASSNIKFLGNPCTKGFLADITPQGTKGGTIASPSGFATFTLESSTGNVKTSITTVEGKATNDYAIGVMSMENDWRAESSTASDKYRFIKLDGVHPEAGSLQGTQVTSNALFSVANGGNGTAPYYTSRYQSNIGAYPFHMEMRTFVANSAPAATVTLMSQITSALGTPSVCADTPRGLSLNPDGVSTCAIPSVIAKGSKGGNNCKALRLNN